MKPNQTIIILFGILVISSMVFSGCVQSGTNATVSRPTTTPALPTPGAAPITAQPGDNVTVIYTGTLDNGVVFDSTVNRTPLTFTLGYSGVIGGFQEAVAGMAVNQEKNVTIPYTKAYGPYRKELVHVVPLTGPLMNKSFKVGTYITVTNKTDNSYSVVKILSVTPTTVTWDENDPLAGENLTFMIRVVNIERK